MPVIDGMLALVGNPPYTPQQRGFGLFHNPEVLMREEPRWYQRRYRWLVSKLLTTRGRGEWYWGVKDNICEESLLFEEFFNLEESDLGTDEVTLLEGFTARSLIVEDFLGGVSILVP